MRYKQEVEKGKVPAEVRLIPVHMMKKPRVLLALARKLRQVADDYMKASKVSDQEERPIPNFRDPYNIVIHGMVRVLKLSPLHLPRPLCSLVFRNNASINISKEIDDVYFGMGLRFF